jgi:hypothetical protein
MKQCLKDSSNGLISDLLKQYSCSERLDAVADFQRELKSELAELVNSENVLQDAEKIRSEKQFRE